MDAARPPAAREIVAILPLFYAARLRRRLMRNPLGRHSNTFSLPVHCQVNHGYPMLGFATVQKIRSPFVALRASLWVRGN